MSGLMTLTSRLIRSLSWCMFALHLWQFVRDRGSTRRVALGKYSS
jgi:hypothetical protein